MSFRSVALGVSVSVLALSTTGAFAHQLASVSHATISKDQSVDTKSGAPRNFTLVLRDDVSVDTAAIEKYFAGHGFKTEYDALSHTISLKGTYAQAEAAGHFSYEKITKGEITFTHPNVKPSFTPEIDKALIGTSFGIGPKNHPLWSKLSPAAGPRVTGQDTKTTEPIDGYTPAEFSKFYDIGPVYGHTTGKGETVDILACGNVLPSDIAAFSTAYGLPTADVTIINIDGNPDYYGLEPTLDVERVHGTAPGAKIRLFTAYECTFGAFVDAFTAIVKDQKKYPADALTISYGATEYDYIAYGYDSYLTSQSKLIAQLTKLGVTVFAAAGDNGSWFYNSSGPSLDTDVIYPGSDTNVIGVGGTTLINDAKDNRVDEHAWGGYDATGGGISSVFKPAAYQRTEPGVYSKTWKNIPDVAFDADPFTGAAMYLASYGGFFGIGGTSASSPSWAGILALLDAGLVKEGKPKISGVGAFLYANQSDFVDVVSGGNGFFAAKVGFDNVTGLGYPDVHKLYLSATK